MRTVLLLLFIYFSVSSLQAQIYYVTYKKGSVTKSGIELKQGDKLLLTDKIVFGDPGASIVIISPQAGRYVLTSTAQSKGGEIKYMIMQVAAVKQTASLNTRGGDPVTDVHHYFGSGNFLFWESPHDILLDTKKWKLSETDFFIYSYTYAGTSIKKKIPSENYNTLVLDKAELYMYKGNTTYSDSLSTVTLYYKTEQSVEHITTFQPVYKTKEELLSELGFVKKAVMSENPSETDEHIQQQLKEYILSIYGRCDGAMLNALISEVK